MESEIYQHWLAENCHLTNTALFNAQMDYRHGVPLADAIRPKDYWLTECAALTRWGF